MRDFRKSKAWQLGDDLTVQIYRVSREFPKEEMFGLTNQLRRAAYSVPANICEGSSRSGAREYLQFLYIARGSSNETQYFVHLAHRLGYLNEAQHATLIGSAEEVGKTLTGLIKAVEHEEGFLKTNVTRLAAWILVLASSMADKAAPFS